MKYLAIFSVCFIFACQHETDKPINLKNIALNKESLQPVTKALNENDDTLCMDDFCVEFPKKGSPIVKDSIAPLPILSDEEKLKVSQEELAKLAPKKQVFEIKNPQNGIVVQGNKGTVINIPKEITQRIPTGVKTELELMEYYGLSDLISSGISTAMEDGRPLQTAGSIYVDVKVDGKSLELSPFDTYEVAFPGKINGEGYGMFYSNNILRDLSSRKVMPAVTWVENSTFKITFSPFIKATKCFNFSEADFTLSYKGIRCNLEEYFLRYFADNPISNKDMESLKTTDVNVSYGVNYLGKPEVIKIEGAITDELKKDLEGFLRFVQFEIIKANKNGSVRRMTHQIGFTDQRPDFKEMECVFTKPGITKTVTHQIALYSKTGNQDVSFGKTTQTYQVNSFGFINCDRFLNTPGKKRSIFVENADSISSYYLVYKNDKSILPGVVRNGVVCYRNIPMDKQVLLVKLLPGAKGYKLIKKFGVAKDFAEKVSLTDNSRAELLSEAALKNLAALF